MPTIVAAGRASAPRWDAPADRVPSTEVAGEGLGGDAVAMRERFEAVSAEVVRTDLELGTARIATFR